MNAGGRPADRGLDGEVVLVTGASSGLGQRFALVLARAGALVAVAGRDETRLAGVAAQIEAEGGRAQVVPFEIQDHESIVSAVDDVERELGLPTILVNCAGVPDARRAHRMPVELVDQVLATNLRGPWLLATEFARRLIQVGRGGRIVNVSSMTAFHYAGEGAALYSVTKAALNRMTEVLAVEWARDRINVNAIAPGAFATPMMQEMIERVGDVTSAFPRGRLGDPSQLDSTLLYLVAPDSEFVTGTVVRVDDGQTHR